MTTPSLWGSEIYVNTKLDEDQGEPSVTALADGRFVVVWTDETDIPEDGNTVVKARIFNADGTPKSEEILVHQGVKSQNQPAVQALSNGNFAVFWTDATPTLAGGGETTDLRGAVYDVNGAVVKAPFVAVTGVTGNQDEPSITSLSDGGFAVAWRDTRDGAGGDGDIRIQKYDALGAKSGGEVQGNVGTADATRQDAPSVAMFGTGYAAVWADADVGVVCRIYDNSNAATPQLLVNTGAPGGQSDPKVTQLKNGATETGFVVTWLDRTHDNDGNEIYTIWARHWDKNAQAFGDEIEVTKYTIEDTNHQYPPKGYDVTALDGGRFLVTWSDGRDGVNSDTDIKGRVFDADGAEGAMFDVHRTDADTYTNAQETPTVTTLRDGRSLIVWSHSNGDLAQGGTGTSVRAQIVDARATTVIVTGDQDNKVFDDDFVGTSFTGIGVGDRLDGRGGNDKLRGEAGHDTLIGGTGNDKLWGGADNDSVDGGADSDELWGDEGNDTVLGGAGDDRLRGGIGDDTIDGGDNNDALWGDAGTDTIRGGFGNDTLWGGSGADILDGGEDANSLDIDLVDYSTATGAVVIDLKNGSVNAGDAQGDTFIGIEGFIASNFDDTFFGDETANVFYGGAGNDRFYGRGGADRFDGGVGLDFACYDDASYGNLDISLANGGALGATFVSIEGLILGAGNDKGVGDANANALYGRGGSDILYGRENNDSLFGESGSDFLYGEAGSDHLDGGTENDQLFGGTENDILYGSAGTDFLYGESGNDVLDGGSENDVLYGGTESDTLNGGTGGDQLHGDAGNDVLNGGANNDVLRGYAGKDVFVFNTALGNYRTDRAVNFDTIRDFSVKDDTIKLENAIFRKLSKTGTLNKKFFKIGAAAADKDDYVLYNNKTGVVSYDADGSGKGKAIEFALLAKNLKLTFADFQII